MDATRHVGLDLGVTNLKWAVVERADDWRVLDKGQVPTCAGEGALAVVQRMAATAASAIERWPGVVAVGVGVPGLYEPATGRTRFIINMPEPDEWVGLPVAEPMARQLGLPVFLINDARAFGLAELRFGAARGAESMIGFTLGTGVGGVVAVNGHVRQGHDGTAGELGHQTIDPDGPWCACGNRGCVEAYVRADQIAAACGTDTAEEAVAAAQAGDEQALSGLREVGRYLGIAVASAITVITPDKVVIGGGVAAAGELLLGPVRDELRRRVRVTSLEAVELVTAELGTLAGAIGAAVHGAERTGG
ncbi:MAG TPA: ROK family protein [Candidatus Limnocylindria bacterium]|nr:ROK family protein [Candidatus Limnocylindria bacterium]